MTHAAMDIYRQQAGPGTGGGAQGFEARLFAQARERARRGQFWARLTGRPQRLFSLNEVRNACAIDAQIDGGRRAVPISRIRGSEGRSGYFDCDFNPLYDRARGRWLNVARARRQALALPPVSLVRVGDLYFVMDGHHRVSVARALGQSDIEARVSIWQVSGRLPWDAPEGETGPNRALGDLRQRAALAFQALLTSIKGVHPVTTHKGPAPITGATD